MVKVVVAYMRPTTTLPPGTRSLNPGETCCQCLIPVTSISRNDILYSAMASNFVKFVRGLNGVLLPVSLVIVV